MTQDTLFLKKLLEENNFLNIITSDLNNYDEVIIENTDISRPGLALVGEMEYFPQNRIQIFGQQEYTYLQKNDQYLETFLAQKIPLIIFSRNNKPDEKFQKLCLKNNIMLAYTPFSTVKLISKLHEYLEKELAPMITEHGVMLSIFGKGILIKGRSGIGKSEIALELIKKGHTLIADDLVIFKQIDNDEIYGSAPELLENKMEIRGIGIVDIQKLFGVTSVTPTKKLDLIINLTETLEGIDRIGTQINYQTIIDLPIKKINIPINLGKNISNLIEVAVANFQLEEDYNYNSAEVFTDKLNTLLINKNKED